MWRIISWMCGLLAPCPFCTRTTLQVRHVPLLQRQNVRKVCDIITVEVYSNIFSSTIRTEQVQRSLLNSIVILIKLRRLAVSQLLTQLS